MIGITTSGNSKATTDYLRKLRSGNLYAELATYGKKGVDALAAATPVESGLTAQSWAYRIIEKGRHVGIEWYNTNTVSGIPVVILIEYGHATGTGGYVSGRKFINPAIQPIFDELSNAVWKKVKA